MISFVIVYAKLAALSSSSLLLRSSTVVRSYEERCALLSRVNRGKIVTITLKGYVFFGSAVKILEEVKSRVILTPAISRVEENVKNSYSNSNSNGTGAGTGLHTNEASIPMFSFLMGGMGTGKKGVEGPIVELGQMQRGAHCKQHQESDGEMGEERGSVKSFYSPNSHKSLHPVTVGSNSATSSKSSKKGSAASYAPLSSSSCRSDSHGSSCMYGAIENTEEEDWEADKNGRDMFEISSRSTEGCRLPPRTYPIPLVQSKSSSTTSSTTVGVDAQHLVGSPLQSLSVYDMPQDVVSSYQRRWMQDRDSSHLALYPPSHTQSQVMSRSASPQSSSGSFLDSTPSPPPDSPLVCRSQSEKCGSRSYKNFLPSPHTVSCKSLSSKSDVSQPSYKASTINALKCEIPQIPFKRSDDAVQPPKIGQRTKSMSHLLLSSSSLTNGSVLSAVWSSQERRREKVKHLSTPTVSTYNGVGDVARDTGKRSKSYDSLGAVVHPADRVAGRADDSIYICIDELSHLPRHHTEDNSRGPGLKPFSLPLHSQPITMEGQGQGQGQGQGGAEPTEFLILDFSEVLGIDATSARSCFLMLVRRTDGHT